MPPAYEHLPIELARVNKPVQVETCYGRVTGGTAATGAAVFLEIPYSLPTARWEDAQPLPSDYSYPTTPFVYETSYASQPMKDGQAAGTQPEDKLGLGKPTEHPFFLNIACPEGFKSLSNIPVKVYIHGGFLQFGSPHGITSQSQYVATERREIWVNIGYRDSRLSAFGFLASEEPSVTGNFGFKDQWLALLWVRENIPAFGGDPNNIQIIGLSAGAHSCHQLLHYASRLPAGEPAPFQSAVLMSNALLLDPKHLADAQPQYDALLKALNIDPGHSSLDFLQDRDAIPAQRINDLIDDEALGAGNGTFRGVVDGIWMAQNPMAWQQSGGFAAGLRANGVKFVVLGDLAEEWYLYSIAHPISTPDDIPKELSRYYPQDIVDRLLEKYLPLEPNATPEQCSRRFGEILSDGQVYVPVRLLARDLQASRFPFVRYHIKWTPPAARSHGLVTHASDASMWRLRHDMLNHDELEVARHWWRAIDEASTQALHTPHAVNRVLTLGEDQSISWRDDDRWQRALELIQHLGL